jgi:hypothetical protein
MNKLLKYNLEMPVFGGYGGGSGGGSGGLSESEVNDLINQNTKIDTGKTEGDTVMSITGADNEGNLLTEKSFVERNIDMKVNPIYLMLK